MHRIDSDTRELNKFGPGKDGFTAGQPGVTAATNLTPDFYNALQEEIARFIEAMNIILDKLNHSQLLQAFRNPIGADGSPALHGTGGPNSGPGLKGTGGGPNGAGLEGEGTGDGPAVRAVAQSGYSVFAQAAGTTRAAMRIVPQGSYPTVREVGAFTVLPSGQLIIADPTTWATPLLQRHCLINQALVGPTPASETGFGGEGVYTIPANALRVGSRIKIVAAGRSQPGGGGNLNLRIRLGTKQVLQTMSVGPMRTSTFYWQLQCEVVVGAIGVNGAIGYHGLFALDSGNDLYFLLRSAASSPPTGLTGFDTTVPQQITVTREWPSGTTTELELFVFTVDAVY